MKTLPEEVLSRLQAWRTSNDNWTSTRKGRVTLWTVLQAEADATQLAAYASLFWPEILEVRGCYLLRERFFQDAFEGWWQELKADKSLIESVVNDISVDELCLNRERKLDQELSTAVAERIAGCWRSALSEYRPAERFHVAVTPATVEEGAHVTFSATRVP